MSNKIDQFFKGKLEGHNLPPAEEAWAKIEANLSKKNNPVVWRVAAAILVAGALITLIIWSPRSDNNQPVIADRQLGKESPVKEKTAPKNSSGQAKEKLAPSRQLMSTPHARENTRHKEEQPQSVTSVTDTPIEKNQRAEKESLALIEKNKPTYADVSEGKLEQNNKVEATTPVTTASTRHKSIKLEFTLDDFSSEPPQATASEEKSSGLKKFWELALEVKNGDGPVREIKNELFARNFKKNKNQ